VSDQGTEDSPPDADAALAGLAAHAASERAEGAKEAKLEWIRKASAGELAIPSARERLIQEAATAGATAREIEEALDSPR
jgi:hypothetical protein